MKTVVVFLWLLTITLGIDIHGIPDVISAVENLVKLDDFDEGSLHALQRKVQELDSKLGEVITQMNSLEFRIKNMLENWQEKLLLDLNINEYFDRKIFIDECYKQLKNYLKTDRYETRTILDFSNNIVSPNPNSIIFKIDSLHRYITDKNENIILKLARFLQDDKAGSRLCDIHQTSQQIFYSFYKSVVLTEIKSFVLIKFAYNYKRIHGEGRFRQELLDEKQRFKNRVNTTIKIFKPFLAKASRQLRKCDPSKHVLGKTYEELTGLLQGVILNEQNLSPSGDCYQSCGSFNYVTKIQCRKHQWCQKQKRCRKVVDCKKLDTKMEVYYKF